MYEITPIQPMTHQAEPDLLTMYEPTKCWRAFMFLQTQAEHVWVLSSQHTGLEGFHPVLLANHNLGMSLLYKRDNRCTTVGPLWMLSLHLEGFREPPAHNQKSLPVTSGMPNATSGGPGNTHIYYCSGMLGRPANLIMCGFQRLQGSCNGSSMDSEGSLYTCYWLQFLRNQHHKIKEKCAK